MYQVGDRVMIRPDIKEGNHIDQEQYVTSEMASFAGAITKIMGGWMYRRGKVVRVGN